MHAAILTLLTGDPDLDTRDLPNRLEDGLPAATADTDAYLDGQRITSGTLAGNVTTNETVPVVAEESIYTEREETRETVVGEYYADLETGWAGVNSSDIQPLLTDYLASAAGVIPEDAALDLDAFAEALPDDVDTNGVVYSTSIDEGHVRDAAGSHWKRDAKPSKIPAEGTSVLHVQYTWDGVLVDAMLAASGYVAVYKEWATSTFARWVADEITPYLYYAGDDQATLSTDSDAEECVECGSTEDVQLLEGEPYCLVHRDAREEAREVDV